MNKIHVKRRERENKRAFPWEDTHALQVMAKFSTQLEHK
jgi:hypothetical protein